jgi:hypothetical protein
MQIFKSGILSLLIVMGIIFSGCCTRPSTSTTDVSATTTTKGQELLDLDTAHEKGLLTEKEYEKQKEQILKRK